MKIKLNKVFAKRLSIVESPLMQTDIKPIMTLDSMRYALDLGYTQLSQDNPHMGDFEVKYEIENGKTLHAIVHGFSLKYGRCRADYYFKDGKWILGAN